jgi:hypothetical protein
MPKRLKQDARPKDVNQLAHHLLRLSTEGDDAPDAESAVPNPPKGLSAYMAALGRKGGKIGGKSRLVTMTSEERREIARKAAKARWKGHKKPRRRLAPGETSEGKP